MKPNIYCCYALIETHQCSISVHSVLFGPLWSIPSISVQFGPFCRIRSTLVYSFHFGPFLSIWSISAHFSSFSPLQWCIVRKGLCRKKSCLIDNYVLSVKLEDFLFDPFSPLLWCIVRRGLCRKMSYYINNYVTFSI